MNVYRTGRKSKAIVIHLVAIIIELLIIFPFLWMIVSSLKFNRDVLAIPIQLVPQHWNWSSYRNVLTKFPTFDFPRYLANSVIVTALSTLLHLVLCVSSGYGFAKYSFRANNLMFTVVLSTIMISFPVIVVPLFILVRQLGMQDSYVGLIVPVSLAAFGVFMMRQFFYGVPSDFIESARIDGANEYQIFARIGVPMAKTAIIALLIFHAQWVWNVLLWPMVVVSSPELQTLPQGLSLFNGYYNTPYPELLAASVMTCIPLLILYVLMSRYFVQGITMTGLKG